MAKHTHTLLGKVQAALKDKDGTSLARAAGHIGSSLATVQRIRDGKGNPAYATVQALADHLGVK